MLQTEPSQSNHGIFRVANPAFRTMASMRVRQWNQRALDPRPFQEKNLRFLLKKISNTKFAKDHKLGDVSSYEAFRSRVPVRPYGGFETYIEDMKTGTPDILWPGVIPFFGKSSGSSNTAAKHKYLPISMEQIKLQQKQAFDLVARYLDITGDRAFLGGKTLGLLPPSVLEPATPGNTKVFVGSNPGIMLRFVPSFAQKSTIPQPPIRDIPDYDEKLIAIANTYLDADVRAISGTTCWFSVFFDHLLKAARDQGRSAKTVSEIWPNLRVLFGGGVYAAPYQGVIRERVGRDIQLMDNYNATEGGIFAATDQRENALSDASMLILPDRGVFFEFVPREEHGKDNPTRVPLWEVEPGVDYSVVVSTPSGLMAYAIGDFVRFTSIFPHRLQFAGRPSGVLSLTQELTSFIEIEKAFQHACAKHQCSTVEYTASSEVGVEGSGKGRYIFFVEFEREPSDVQAFCRSVDEELGRQNRVYGEHRISDVSILPPRMVEMPHGVTKKFMNKLGYRSVQNKFPRIINEERRDLLTSLIHLQTS